MQAHRYPEMFQLIRQASVDLSEMIAGRFSLEEGAAVLQEMNTFPLTGIGIITSF